MNNLAPRIFPPANDYGRAYGSAGAILLVAGIIISPHLRAALSSRPLKLLGRLSFPIYLLHATFMRSILAWIMFVGTSPITVEERDPDGRVMKFERIPLPGPFRTAVAVGISMGLCLVAAYAWAERVEPVFARITKVAEERMMGKGGELRTPLPVRREEGKREEMVERKE
jgi:hypothetical protein